MNMLCEIRSDLNQLLSQESALLLQQKAIEQQLVELRIRISVYNELVTRYSSSDVVDELQIGRTQDTGKLLVESIGATDKSDVSRKRMSSQMSAEVWRAIKSYLSDGELRKVSDIKQNVEEALGIGEINRTTVQSILRRNEQELEKPEQGYYRLKK